MRASQKHRTLEPNERPRRIQGSQPEVEADEPVPPRVDEDSSAGDGYSNDFAPETSSSRGGKYGQVDDGLDAMRLNSFPALSKPERNDPEASGPRVAQEDDGNETGDMLIQKELIVNLETTASKGPLRSAA